MGRNSQHRRARTLRQDTSRAQFGAGKPSVDDLLELATRTAFGPGANKVLFARSTEMLQRLETDSPPPQRPGARVQQQLQRLTDSALEAGWHPADLVHVVKRDWTLRASRLATAFVADHARRFDAPVRAPHLWLGQLQDLGVVDAERTSVVGGRGDLLAAWARTEKLHPEEALIAAIQVVSQFRQLPRLPVTLTVPSAWGASNRGLAASPRSAEGIDAKALKLIRALLAKAEATTFEAEAETFTTKAQEMMTRHSIDAAVLASAATGGRTAAGVESRRVHIDNPYADEKATFLSAISSVNGVRSIWLPHAGFCTMMGFPVDLQLTDLLFTSLLVQATRASAAATAANRNLSTPSFRRAFLIAFADRIAERLEAARNHVAAEAAAEYGESLLPVLASREAAVEAAYTEAFPNATTMRSRSLNAAGWHAGRAAADAADIGAGAAITRGS